jgi:hypothetical protein
MFQRPAPKTIVVTMIFNRKSASGQLKPPAASEPGGMLARKR